MLAFTVTHPALGAESIYECDNGHKITLTSYSKSRLELQTEGGNAALFAHKDSGSFRISFAGIAVADTAKEALDKICELIPQAIENDKREPALEKELEELRLSEFGD